jgi:hypothetical protein
MPESCNHTDSGPCYHRRTWLTQGRR